PDALVVLADRQNMDRDGGVVAIPSGEERSEAKIRAGSFEQSMSIIDPADGACHAVEDNALAALLNIQHEIEQAIIISEGCPTRHARI
ncbi:hypothetical protein, partial [Sphingomonas sp. CROZ-RG-20F-R02-07]|uniref:hypothetical protein n=1 Tax=Sphingomonas sp. CROZ-RG-20F-R02-07 TaxID=2914832 RepID=UPI001F5678C0